MIHITKKTYSCKITPSDQYERQTLERFVRSYLTHMDYSKKLKEGGWKIKKVYASWVYGSLYIHINSLGSLLSFINTKASGVYEISSESQYEPLNATIDIQDGWKPRDYQEPILEFSLKEREYPATLVGLQTGRGKTVIGCFNIHHVGKVTVVMTKPNYMGLWQQELKKILKVEDEDIFVLRGITKLNKILKLSLDNKNNYKIILIASATYANYIKAYETQRDIPYHVNPDKFMETVGAGNMLIDEVHEHNYTYFKVMLYSNVPRIIALSATLVNEDPFLEKIYSIEFPPDNRYDQLEMLRYIDYIKMEYQITSVPIKKIRLSEYGSKSYSHHVYERNFMMNDRLFNNFVTMLINIIKAYYITRRTDEDKLLMFVSGIDFANKLAKRINKELPKLEIITYLQDDEYDKLMSYKNIISTPGKAGTAVDISDLFLVINTVSMRSLQRTIQMLGRLRPRENKDLIFLQLINIDLPKHRDFQKVRDRVIKPRVRSMRSTFYKNSI